MHVQNVHTMDELKMTGNCLKGSRGLLSFDQGFEETEWGRLTKEVFTQVCTPFALPFVFSEYCTNSIWSDLDFWRAFNG